ncbi:MAG: histidine phosphatase family protein [Cyclobacteriaceae bacterium]|jgi:phosphohistidine phosphatase|nr:histidine phosphatase family protein [Cyclobacteriaceae bacterium]
MKTLLLVRHAKSSWDRSHLSDIERPLNGRGKRDIPKMAEFIKGIIDTPQVFISSPAVRAYSTAIGFANVFNINEKEIARNSGLYHGSKPTWVKLISELDININSVIMFGHNPGITDFVNKMTNSNIYNIPTCGVAGIKLNINSWSDIASNSGKLEFYHFPKGIDS